MQKKNFQTIVFMVMFLFGGIVSLEKAWGADGRYQGFLECGFEEVTADSRTPLVVEKGVATTVTCQVTNYTNERAFSVFVLGKQSYAGATIASSGTNIVLEKGAIAGAVISFPAAFQSGEYGYVFTAMDTETGALLASEVSLTSIIRGDTEPVQLERVVFDKEQYQWGDPFDMTVFLKTTDRLVILPDRFSLGVVMETREGGECAVLKDKVVVTESVMKIHLDFPQNGSCINALRISLKDADGKVTDQKVVAIDIPLADFDARTTSGNTSSVQNLFASMPKIFWIFLVLTGVLVLALVGYMMVRNKKF